MGGGFALKLWRRALVEGRAQLTLLFFHARVLEGYRGRPGFTLLRTDTVARLRGPSWSVDLGISPDGETVHVALGDFLERLPPPEREAWLGHLACPPLSENYARARLYPGSCVDDGPLRPW